MRMKAAAAVRSSALQSGAAGAEPAEASGAAALADFPPDAFAASLLAEAVRPSAPGRIVVVAAVTPLRRIATMTLESTCSVTSALQGVDGPNQETIWLAILDQ